MSGKNGSMLILLNMIVIMFLWQIMRKNNSIWIHSMYNFVTGWKMLLLPSLTMMMMSGKNGSISILLNTTMQKKANNQNRLRLRLTSMKTTWNVTLTLIVILIPKKEMRKTLLLSFRCALPHLSSR